LVFTISAVTTLAHANNAMPPKVGGSDGVVCRRKPPTSAERAIPMFWQSVLMPNPVLESLGGRFCAIITLTRVGTVAAEMPILEHRKTEEVQSSMQSRIGQTPLRVGP
jgi:hypothetical protein